MKVLVLICSLHLLAACSCAGPDSDALEPASSGAPSQSVNASGGPTAGEPSDANDGASVSPEPDSNPPMASSDPEGAANSCISWSLEPNLAIEDLTEEQARQACIALSRCHAPFDRPREVDCELSAVGQALRAEPQPGTDPELVQLCLDTKATCLETTSVPDIDREQFYEDLAMNESLCARLLSCGQTLGAAARCAENIYNLRVSCSDLTLAMPPKVTVAGCELCLD